MSTVALYRISNWHTATRRVRSEFPGRYAAPEGIPTQYFSLHPATAWAEFIRHEAITTPAHLAQTRSRLWVSTADLSGFVEITFANAKDKFDISPEELINDDYFETQALVQRLLAQDPGLLGLIAPSAALPGTQNVIMFGPRTDAPYAGPVKGQTGIRSAVAANDSSYLKELLALVCHFGQPHAEYVAYQQGRPFKFRQPTPGALARPSTKVE